MNAHIDVFQSYGQKPPSGWFALKCLHTRLVALLGVVAIGGTLRMIGIVRSVLGLAGRKVDDPWRGAVGDAHSLDYVEVAR